MRASGTQAAGGMGVIGGLVLLFFFLSGCTGLIYEVVWTRLLRHLMGNTVFSMTTVLCAFMGGLALGSFLAGRLIDRRGDALRLYAIFEGAIALYCLLLPVLIVASTPFYAYIYEHFQDSYISFGIIRFVFCGLLLLPASTLMGATLPVLTKFFARSLDRVGGSIGRLYAINTFGAVVGAFSTGFILLPLLGTSRTLYLACGVNGLICVAAYVVYLRSRAGPAAVVKEGRATAAEEGGTATAVGEHGGGLASQVTGMYGRQVGALLLAGYALSGAASMVYEVAWFRALSLLIGSSAYAFSLMLTAFILGLALGSWACGRFADRSRDPMRSLAIVEIGIGCCALMVVPLFGWLPFFMTGLISRISQSFWMLQFAEFSVLFLVMTVPTILMGAAFPLAIRIYTRSTASVGRSVGMVYSTNTLGSIVGAFTGGFVLLPWLGIQSAILTGVLLNIIVGCAFLACSASMGVRRKVVTAAVVMGVSAVICGLVPRWDQGRMSFGPFIRARRLSNDEARSRSTLEEISKRSRVLFHKEGVCTTVTVKQAPNGERVLYVNGKPDASSFGDLPTQTLSAHIPMLLHSSPRSVLVIGLASGVTLGSAGLYPVEVLDCVEISPAVVEACEYFNEQNHEVLKDPRARVFIEDGRNHLALTRRTYDVIISEPSNPWIAGIGDLFTREFYEVCRDRLNPGGVMCGWLNSYNIDEASFRSIVRTFHQVFPEMTLWQPKKGDFLLVGCKGKLRVDLASLEGALAVEAVSDDLRRVGVRNAVDLLARFLMGRTSVERFGRGAQLHTDDNAMLEFSAPRTMFSDEVGLAIRDAVKEHTDSDLSFLAHGGLDGGQRNALEADVSRIRRARDSLAGGKGLLRRGQGVRALPHFEEAVRLDPNLADAHFVLGIVLGQQERFQEALDHLAMAIRLNPDHREALERLGTIRMNQGRLGEAIRHYRRALEANPHSESLHYKLGCVLVRVEQLGAAVAEFEEVLRLNPEHGEAREELKKTKALQAESELIRSG